MREDFFLEKITIEPGITRTFATGEGWYGILLLTDNGCLAQWNEQARRCGREDILLAQPGQRLTLQTQTSRRPARVLWLRLSEQALVRLSDERTDLLHSMNLVPFGCTSVYAGSHVAMLARNLSNRLAAEMRHPDFGNAILEQGLLSLLLILVLRACIAADFRRPGQERPRFMVDDLFVYIRDHLAEELSLARLEQVFFVSHEHIAREFKKQTGQSVHRYILTLRLEQSCYMLRAGQPVSRLWQSCGFASYSYFFQAFRRELGMTPGEYVKTLPPQH